MKKNRKTYRWAFALFLLFMAGAFFLPETLRFYFIVIFPITYWAAYGLMTRTL